MTTEWQPRYQPALPLAWQGRSDQEKGTTRFHEVVHCLDLKKGFDIDNRVPHIGFLGLASDEGIIRNQGRKGAEEGPRFLRSALAKYPVPENNSVRYCDCGDITCSDQNLEASSQALKEILFLSIKENIHPILFGGGHEIAWAHYQGLTQAYPNQEIGVINFDAHFDLRPTLAGDKGTSGSPFYQISEWCNQQGQAFRYGCIGIQTLGNTPALFQTAKNRKAQFVTAEEIHQGEMEKAKQLIDTILERSTKVMLSVCLDIFAAAFAPGVSAPQPLGLSPWHVVYLLSYLADHPKIAGLHIAELSPPHDSEGRTANLAAHLVATYVQKRVLSLQQA